MFSHPMERFNGIRDRLEPLVKEIKSFKKEFKGRECDEVSGEKIKKFHQVVKDIKLEISSAVQEAETKMKETRVISLG